MTRIRDLSATVALVVVLSVTASAGTITGSRSSVDTVSESRAGTITGSRAGTITDSKTGTITGSLTGDSILSYMLGIVAYAW